MDCKDALTTEPPSGVCARVLRTPRDAPCVHRRVPFENCYYTVKSGTGRDGGNQPPYLLRCVAPNSGTQVRGMAPATAGVVTKA